MTQPERIPEEVLKVLRDCKIVGNIVALGNKKLRQDNYYWRTYTHNFLEVLGGKHRASKNDYEFDFDPANLIRQVCETGILPEKGKGDSK